MQHQLSRSCSEALPEVNEFYSASGGYIVTNQTRYITPEETLTLSDMDILIGAIDAYNISQYGTWSVASAETQYMTVNSASGAATGKKHKTRQSPLSRGAKLMTPEQMLK